MASEARRKVAARNWHVGGLGSIQRRFGGEFQPHESDALVWSLIVGMAAEFEADAGFWYELACERDEGTTLEGPKGMAKPLKKWKTATIVAGLDWEEERTNPLSTIPLDVWLAGLFEMRNELLHSDSSYSKKERLDERLKAAGMPLNPDLLDGKFWDEASAQGRHLGGVRHRLMQALAGP